MSLGLFSLLYVIFSLIIRIKTRQFQLMKLLIDFYIRSRLLVYDVYAVVTGSH